ncbi:hypothetical protein F4859DRAFT_526416 [Xylaria cf. heliscus]|nr:hypothetical protein F4859DRAFT_526416 [Xylaria cf. heliscus]
MAEPLAIIGAVAAVTQVTGDLVKLTTNLRRYLKVIHRAPEEVQAFVMETSNFTGLLNFFTELAYQPVKDIGRRERGKREERVSMVEKQCAYVCHKMKYLVERFSGLANGNMTRWESVIERLRYLLDKPDVKDLRLSVQLAATTINTMSTLFLWEQAANSDTRSRSLLQQLKNLLPVAKRASTELAVHRKQHGVMYESGMPDPNNDMLAVSKEIQRQVTHVIRPHVQSEAAENERWDRNPHENFGEQTSRPQPWSLPSRSCGDHYHYLSDRGAKASHKGAAAQQASLRESQSPHAEFPSLPANSARKHSELGSGRTLSEERKRMQINQTTHDDQSTGTRSKQSRLSGEQFVLDMPDPMKPRVHPCDRCCVHEYCTLCDASHCSRDCCLFKEQTTSTKDKTVDSNTPKRLSLLSDAERATSNEGSSREGTRSSSKEQARPSPTTTIESEEVSGLSDADIDSAIGRWSPTDPSLPSSKSSSPSTAGPGSPETKNWSSTAVHPAENGSQEAPDLGQKVSDVPEKPPQPQTKQERSQHLGPAHEEKQRLETRDKSPKEERWRGSGSPPSELHISDAHGASSGEEGPSPYVPMAPFGGPGGRRRPRRPQSKMAR